MFEKMIETLKGQGRTIVFTEGPDARILEAAADMAYRTADIEDAYKKGCFTYDTLCRELMEAGEKAREEGINVLQTPLTAYEICARLAAAGLPGKNREA